MHAHLHRKMWRMASGTCMQQRTKRWSINVFYPRKYASLVKLAIGLYIIACMVSNELWSTNRRVYLSGFDPAKVNFVGYHISAPRGRCRLKFLHGTLCGQFAIKLSLVKDFTTPKRVVSLYPVSYTHLTLPTILRV